MPDRDKWTHPQPTLSGYTAWVFRQLGDATGKKPGPLAEWIIDSWVAQNSGMLAQDYSIKREQFTRAQKIVQHPSSR
jgi:hypothetical protein